MCRRCARRGVLPGGCRRSSRRARIGAGWREVAPFGHQAHDQHGRGDDRRPPGRTPRGTAVRPAGVLGGPAGGATGRLAVSPEQVGQPGDGWLSADGLMWSAAVEPAVQENRTLLEPWGLPVSVPTELRSTVKVPICRPFVKSGRLDLNQRPLGPQPTAHVCRSVPSRPQRPHRPRERTAWTHKT